MINLTIKRIRNNLLARNTCWMFIGQGLSVVIQALFFVLLARSLRSQGYGSFVGVVALVGILAPFAGFGSGNLLIKNVARNQDCFARYFGTALLFLLLSGSVLLLTLLCLSRLAFPSAIPVSLVLLVGVSELFLARALEISGQAFQAFERLHRTALLQFLPHLFKLVAVVGLNLCVDAPTVLHWGVLYLLTTLLGTLIGVWLVYRELGAPVFAAPAGIKTEIREGFYFSLNQSARGINNDIDKTMLARFSTLEATGIYGAAYRIINVSFAPILALLFAAYVGFFQAGATGIRGGIGFAKKLFPFAGVYGVVAGMLLVALSPLLPLILGAEYGEAADALCWLAPLPFLKAVQLFTADTLTGAGFQGMRSGIQLFVALCNVTLNFWLIPIYSWRGAAWASIASDGLLAILMCSALYFLSCRAADAQ